MVMFPPDLALTLATCRITVTPQDHSVGLARPRSYVLFLGTSINVHTILTSFTTLCTIYNYAATEDIMVKCFITSRVPINKKKNSANLWWNDDEIYDETYDEIMM
jgi:hypothetical protein